MLAADPDPKTELSLDVSGDRLVSMPPAGKGVAALAGGGSEKSRPPYMSLITDLDSALVSLETPLNVGEMRGDGSGHSMESDECGQGLMTGGLFARIRGLRCRYSGSAALAAVATSSSGNACVGLRWLGLSGDLAWVLRVTGLLRYCVIKLCSGMCLGWTHVVVAGVTVTCGVDVAASSACTGRGAHVSSGVAAAGTGPHCVGSVVDTSAGSRAAHVVSVAGGAGAVTSRAGTGDSVFSLMGRKEGLDSMGGVLEALESPPLSKSDESSSSSSSSSRNPMGDDPPRP